MWGAARGVLDGRKPKYTVSNHRGNPRTPDSLNRSVIKGFKPFFCLLFSKIKMWR